MNHFLKKFIMIGVGYSTNCLWQVCSGVAGCPVEVEGSEDEMEADSLGEFFEEHNGDECLPSFSFRRLLVKIQDILHLPPNLELFTQSG